MYSFFKHLNGSWFYFKRLTFGLNDFSDAFTAIEGKFERFLLTLLTGCKKVSNDFSTALNG